MTALTWWETCPSRLRPLPRITETSAAPHSPSERAKDATAEPRRYLIGTCHQVSGTYQVVTRRPPRPKAPRRTPVPWTWRGPRVQPRRHVAVTLSKTLRVSLHVRTIHSWSFTIHLPPTYLLRHREGLRRSGMVCTDVQTLRHPAAVPIRALSECATELLEVPERLDRVQEAIIVLLLSDRRPTDAAGRYLLVERTRGGRDPLPR
jgi:hypothetical protein